MRLARANIDIASLERAAQGKPFTGANITIKGPYKYGGGMPNLLVKQSSFAKLANNQFTLVFGSNPGKADIAFQGSRSLADENTEIAFDKDARMVSVTDLGRGNTTIITRKEGSATRTGEFRLAQDENKELPFDQAWEVVMGDGTALVNSPRAGQFSLVRKTRAGVARVLVAVHDKIN